MTVTRKTWKEGAMYVSYCPELDVASCGTTKQQAKDNLVEVIEITITETRKMGTFERYMAECGLP